MRGGPYAGVAARIQKRYCQAAECDTSERGERARILVQLLLPALTTSSPSQSSRTGRGAALWLHFNIPALVKQTSDLQNILAGTGTFDPDRDCLRCQSIELNLVDRAQILLAAGVVKGRVRTQPASFRGGKWRQAENVPVDARAGVHLVDSPNVTAGAELSLRQLEEKWVQTLSDSRSSLSLFDMHSGPPQQLRTSLR